MYICIMSKAKYDRQYLGITVTAQNYRELMDAAIKDGKNPRYEINYHNKHLKAYLKGRDTFTYGFRYDEDGNKVGPAIFKVQEKLTKIN